MIEHSMGCAALTGNCTCKSPAPKYTVEVPSGDVADGSQKAINQAIHDAWQEGYAQGRKDERWERDAADKEAEALERRLKDDPLHKLYLASRGAGIQRHD